MKNSLYVLGFIVFIFGSLFLSTGCSTDPATIPSFVKIDTIYVDSTSYDSTGSNASKIDFAWVYINDNLQGVYKLPAKFPVIGEGVKNFKIFGGVYEFGNGYTATRYLFYDEWETNDTLVVEDTLVLQPHVRYNVGLKVPVDNIQDFDSGFPFFQSDMIMGASSPGYYNSATVGGNPGLCGSMSMITGDEGNMVIESATAMNVPKGLAGYFVELDYKCNSPFYFDIKTSLGSRSIIGFNTKDYWNKAYINVTYAMDVTPGTDVKLVFTMPRDTTLPNQDVYLDNIKLIYQP